MQTLTINDLAEAAGLNLKKTKALRHQETNKATGRTSWDLWWKGEGEFELHQSLYDNTWPIGDSDHIVSFLAPSPKLTVFAGVWEVCGRKDCPHEVIDPLIERTRSHQYELKAHDLLQKYCGRMVVNWPTARTWHRRLSKVTVDILEIHEEGWDVQPFPGFRKFTLLVSKGEKIPATWREVLRTISGVYLLVDTQDGKQYVGSASGEGGLYQRFSDYVKNRHGGNEGLRLRKGRDYTFAVLETFGSMISPREILEREEHWKTILGSRKHGLNLN